MFYGTVKWRERESRDGVLLFVSHAIEVKSQMETYITGVSVWYAN